MNDPTIDLKRSTEILDRLNRGDYDHVEAVQASGIPEIDGRRILDRRGISSWHTPDSDYRDRLSSLAPEIPAIQFGTMEGNDRYFDEEDLTTIGVLLFPYVAYGVLNGGSASSYADHRKNEGFSAELFSLYQREFEGLADSMKGKPKGITPAFLQPDGSEGPSFLELKFRHLILARDRYFRTADKFGLTPPKTGKLLPVFEMTSAATEPLLRTEYEKYRSSPLLFGGEDILETIHREQPLLAAFTHSGDGSPRRIFDRAYGKQGALLGLPGGHGQNFQVLAPVYRELHAMGKRFAYLGNVDNLGFTVDPVGIALLALSDSQAGFDFSFRTPVDVKGGILLYDQRNRLNCADIGPAIPKGEVFRAEREGKRILFNCATGLFNLDFLVPHLDDVIDDLPMRISDQEKDAGRYSQAEQVTWEIIGMLDDFLVFGIDKYKRFLAAKMMVEMLMTSGLHLKEAQQLQSTVRLLHEGLQNLLEKTYGMTLEGELWKPR